MKFKFYLFVFWWCTSQIFLNEGIKAQNISFLLNPDSTNVHSALNLKGVTFRGMSVYKQQVVYCSGTKGVIGISVNKGVDFKFKQIKDYKRSDFRDIHLFDQQNAIVSSAGYPAVVLKTKDAGENWESKFMSSDSAIFIDGFDFKGKKGVMLADPIKNKFMVYYSKNAGDSWQLIDTSLIPISADFESAFAASGTAIKWISKDRFAFVSGGKVSKLYVYHLGNQKWQKIPLPIIQGNAAQGAFSFSPFKQNGRNCLLIVGGDYTSDSISVMSTGICVVDLENFQVIASAKGFPYQSCVEEIGTGVFFSTGNNSSQIFKFENKQIQLLKQFSTGFHVNARAGKKLFLAGAKGKLAEIEIP